MEFHALTLAVARVQLLHYLCTRCTIMKYSESVSTHFLQQLRGRGEVRMPAQNHYSTEPAFIKQLDRSSLVSHQISVVMWHNLLTMNIFCKTMYM